ncbi:hypothetical protein [Gleimia coleocanis]|nr:hypothetical protein [Gleimia coleocanis]
MTRFRRPAMLSSEQAENIIGAENPAVTLHLAQTAARSLIGLTDEEFTEEAAQNLVQTIKEHGIDVVADLWENQPPYTLPGAFWRIFLFHQWYQRDKETVENRFAEGIFTLQASGHAGAVEKLNLGALGKEIDALFNGEIRISQTEWGRLTPLLERVAVAMWVLATGATYGNTWIESDADELATEVTRRAKALSTTAEELKLAADRDASGNLF